MRTKLFMSTLIVAALVLSTAWAQTPGAVRIDGGMAQGVSQGDVVVYRGLPFAAPPVGDLRWQAPQPVKPWQGVRKADAFGPGCIQDAPPPTSPGRGGTYAEDCLYLNVWRPAKASGPLPVMVWFYGGGFVGGSAAWDLFDASALARHGVMVVTFNYRLGPLGFLAHPELTKESGHNASGNYGLMDAIAALQWVRRNAAALGGDPQRVTAFGQSAGSQMINELLVSPEARGMITGAIGESSASMAPLDSLAPGGIASLAPTEKAGADYAAKLGATTLADLRKLPPEKFLPSPPWARPIVDGWIVPAAPHDAFAAGKQTDVPTLIGSNAQEANFPTLQPPAKVENLRGFLTSSFGPFGPRLEQAYPFTTDDEAWRAKVEFLTDFGGRWQVWSWARLQASTGKAAVFYYQFAQPEPLKDKALAGKLGAPHASEMLFVFQNKRLPDWDWGPQDRRLAEQMAGYWTNFAKTGDPNGPGLPPWPRFVEAQRNVMLLKSDPAAGELPGWSRLELIDEMIRYFK
jgi:para-nitrobenzyl esterase